jgi:hypothetical protein
MRKLLLFGKFRGTIRPHHGNLNERKYLLLDRLKVSQQLLVSVHIGHFFGRLLC